MKKHFFLLFVWAFLFSCCLLLITNHKRTNKMDRCLEKLKSKVYGHSGINRIILTANLWIPLWCRMFYLWFCTYLKEFNLHLKTIWRDKNRQFIQLMDIFDEHYIVFLSFVIWFACDVCIHDYHLEYENSIE